MNENEIREYEQLREHCQELENRLASLIELFEVALAKDEKLHADNEKLIQILYDRDQEMESLLHRMDELRDDYIDILGRYQKIRSENETLRNVLMESRGFRDEKELEEWIHDFLSHPVRNDFQA